jgi:hypothetical protein
VDQNAIEDLFERNADMRLLEFRHNEPGKGAPPNKRTGSTFSAESIVSNSPDVETEKAPRLRVTIAAAPQSGVIPGAVVGVAIDVFNDGNAPAPESKLLVSTPIESEYRTGTLRVDGREVQSPEQLFAQGLPIARLPGATSSKVTFQLAVLPGVNTLYLQPRLQTNGVPVVGTAGVTIKRGSTAAPQEAPRPFYELEVDEADEVTDRPGEEAILPPVLPPVEREATATAIALPLEVAPEPPPVPVPAPVPVPEPVAVVAEPAIEAVVAPVAAPPPVVAPKPPKMPAKPPVAAAPPAPKKSPLPTPAPKAPLGTTAVPEDRMVRYRTVGQNDIALLDRLFTAEVPGIIAHYVMISSIACSEPGTGDDTSGYGAFLRRDIELLGRALVHSRMGKAPQYRVAQVDLDGLALPWQVPQPQSFPPQRRLRRDLRKPEWTAIGALTQPSERDATLRTRIALLALAGATIEGVDRRVADECEIALAAYRSSVLAWLVPLCVASAGTDGFVIPNPPPTVDTTGRRLVAVLKSALTS